MDERKPYVQLRMGTRKMEEQVKSTHRAEVIPISLEKHPDADSLSVVKVWNFTCVVRTEDWTGIDKAVYVTPDSALPDKPEYRFLKDTSSTRKDRETINKLVADGKLSFEEFRVKLEQLESKIDGNTKYLRIAARKLRGIWSMGMLLPIPPCEYCEQGIPTSYYSEMPEDGGGCTYHTIHTVDGVDKICTDTTKIGDDLAEVMGITHYEPPPEPIQGPSRRHAGADVGPPPPVPLAPKYDIESAYRYASEVFEPGELVYVTEKIHGQNARFVLADDFTQGDGDETQRGKMYAGSHTEWKLLEGESNWWQVQKQNPWIAQWCVENRNKLLYGENYGWVQSLRYGAKIPGTLFFRAFDILDTTRWLDAEEFIAALPEDRRVPMLGIMPYNFEELVKLADGLTSLIPTAKNQLAEGIVIKPIKERYHRKLGRVLLKLVSRQYLEKSAR